MERTIETIIDNIEKAIVGKRDVIEKVLMALLCDGHILLDDVPGGARPRWRWPSAERWAWIIGAIQCTPDVLPSDIVGFSMYDRAAARSAMCRGVVSEANLILADEINRTSSKTQSALLEAMEEKQVTVDARCIP
jgi:MoxR-like ATPase